MYAKPIVLFITAACGVSTELSQPEREVTAAVEPDPDDPDEATPGGVQEDQHFCCTSLNGNGSGGGCITIDITHVSSCTMVLYCGGSYENNNGNVKCLP